MKRYAVCNKEDLVINVIKWDGESNWQPPVDCYAIQDDSVNIGDSYNKETNIFTKNIIVSPE